MDMSNKEIHDALLANKPDDAEHDAETCSFCGSVEAASEEETVAETIYTHEQHETLLNAAVEGAVAEAKEEGDAELLQANDRIKELEADLAARDETIAGLEAEKAEREEKDRLEALAAERVEKVKEVASFTDEQISARRDRWARMDEEDFDSMLTDYKELGSQSKAVETASSFDGTRSTAGTEDDEFGALRNLFAGAGRGV